ncbi:hypothetical protein H696_02670 [Fonticula alba]|uniref:Integrator complex subunit 11 n=1 Tax=Fonticula alba TaxID=691883 RepID=A0A058Z8T7_FONAL|nr:hypothetical protein H696_02670 [Fonticula alba]KCV70343.1 hypothetical protein H696_02670 [Fonticula alba]|eukprot:XP_009494859.1 hypothetical protein H696_02670 [Fonticula alba]
MPSLPMCSAPGHSPRPAAPIFNFLVLYYYCTLSLRDHILLVNGSRIHSWWLIHHYLSALLSGILLVWPDLPNFPVTRQQINLFYIIVGAIQLLQFRYQMGRLRTLRTLGKRRPLDVVSGDAAIVVDGPGSRTASSILSPVSPLTPSVSAASTAAMAAAVAAASAGSSASATATAAATAAAASLAAAGDSGALTSTESTPGVICPPLAGAGVGGSTSSVAVAGGATGRARSGSREGGLLGSTIGRLNMILPFLIAGQMCQLFNGFSCLVIAFSRGRSDIDLYDVGRSCVLVKIGNKQVMFDCGMHMGYEDHRRFPNFSLIANPSPGSFEKVIDAVIITHFHLDHCGALPHFTEKCGYNGPIYMTHPTKAISPILLEDFRRIVVEKKGESDFFTTEDIWNCMKKVVTVNIHQTIKVDDELEIRAYYAGHVIGAAMFHIRVGHQSVVYTGDYNMTPDRHLGAAWIEPLRPDLLITESTYATTVRESKRARERDFLTKVHECVSRGGKVLIPCFALGRAQELCILIEQFWDRNNLSVPVYFSAGMTDKANHYYKLFINWTNDRIKKTFVRRNAFDFKYIRSFDRSYADLPGPMVLFATPGMLHAGTSLEVFKKWAPDPRNMLIMPGYCVAGTVGARVLAGQKEIEIDKKYIPVNLSVRNMSFSAHADAKGIMQLIHMAKPRKVMLVHGEKKKMYAPPRGNSLSIGFPPPPADVCPARPSSRV